MSQSVNQPFNPGQDTELAQFETSTVLGTKFEITSRYTQLEPIGVGISGLVCSAKDLITKNSVAIKKLKDPFQTKNVAAHTFRELKLIKELRHDNINHLKDIFISPSEDIYLVTELLAINLDTLLKNKTLEDQFTQYFLYQIMRGLKYVHSAGVIHRDMKPSNILVNANCDLKICDFGLARLQEDRMTGYVSTRYYRAPEIMLTWKRYNEKVDIWSAGCIFAEMIMGRPIFPGKDHIDQFSVITKLRGSPPEDLMANVTSPSTVKFVSSLPTQIEKPLSSLLPGVDSQAIALLEKMLQIDPDKRCSASESLEAKYLAPYHDSTDEPVTSEKFDWDLVEADLSADTWKALTYREVLNFHEKVEVPKKRTVQFDGWDFE